MIQVQLHKSPQLQWWGGGGETPRVDFEGVFLKILLPNFYLFCLYFTC